MSAYNNIDDAYESAKSTIETIAKERGWTSAQSAMALNDVRAAYDENSGVTDAVGAFVENLSFSGIVDNALTLGGALAEDTQITLANSFWASVRDRSVGWSSFPSYDKVAAWLGSSVVAAKSAETANDAQSQTGAVIDGVVATSEDVKELTVKAVDVASDPKTWYLLGVAALLGATVYIRGIFR